MFIKLKAFLSKLAERREKRKELNVVLSIYELFLDYNPADFTYVGSISEYQQKLLEDLDFTVEHKADRVLLKRGPVVQVPESENTRSEEPSWGRELSEEEMDKRIKEVEYWERRAREVPTVYAAPYSKPWVHKSEYTHPTIKKD